jgi:hypothetical protein
MHTAVATSLTPSETVASADRRTGHARRSLSPTAQNTSRESRAGSRAELSGAGRVAGLAQAKWQSLGVPDAVS